MCNQLLKSVLVQAAQGEKPAQKQIAKLVCEWDKAGRAYVKSEYVTDSSNAVRAPSRAYPFSMYKHAHTRKYARQLLEVIS